MLSKLDAFIDDGDGQVVGTRVHGRLRDERSAVTVGVRLDDRAQGDITDDVLDRSHVVRQ